MHESARAYDIRAYRLDMTNSRDASVVLNQFFYSYNMMLRHRLSRSELRDFARQVHYVRCNSLDLNIAPYTDQSYCLEWVMDARAHNFLWPHKSSQ